MVSVPDVHLDDVDSVFESGLPENGFEIGGDGSVQYLLPILDAPDEVIPDGIDASSAVFGFHIIISLWYIIADDVVENNNKKREYRSDKAKKQQRTERRIHLTTEVTSVLRSLRSSSEKGQDDI